MEVTITIPDKFVPPSIRDEEISRDMLEAYAIENYRQLKMSLGQLSELLDLSIDEANALLKRHNVPPSYSREDLEIDRQTVDKFLNK